LDFLIYCSAEFDLWDLVFGILEIAVKGGGA
jgi:hypothetical protein